MDKIIDPFINVQNVDPSPMTLDSLTGGGASQNFFGVLYIGGDNPIVLDGQNGRLYMKDSSGNINGLFGNPF